MTPRAISLSLCILVLCGFSPAQGRVSADEALAIARAAVEALGGNAASQEPVRETEQGVAFEGDDRWSVLVDNENGQIRMLWDFLVDEPDHEHPEAEAPPSDEDVAARGREILLKVCPDTDFSAFHLDLVLRWGGQWVNPIWRQQIPENGFPGGGVHSVTFCWLDGTVRDLGAYAQPIPDAWRRPATITEEQALEIAQKAVRFREGLKVVYAAEKAFEGYGEDVPYQPVWQVIAWDGSVEDPDMRTVFGGCLIDPWTGKVLAIPDYEAAGGPPAGAQLPSLVAVGPGGQGRSWLRYAIGGAVALTALGLVGLLLRRRKGA